MRKYLFIYFCFISIIVQASTKDSILNEIKNSELKFRTVLIKQAILESGNFKSKFFLKTNNIFGMKFPKRRKTLAIGKIKGYAVFKSWQDAIDDFKLYQSSIKVKNKNDYLKFLEKQYAFKGYCKELSKIKVG